MLSFTILKLSTLVLLFSPGVLSQIAPAPPAGDPTISPTLYSLFYRYSLYAAASYASTCPTPPSNSTVVQYFNNATTDTQATLFRDDARKELVLALRGTSDPQDFSTDFAAALVPLNAVGTADCQGCQVHNGTLTAWNSVSSEIRAAMQAQLSQYSGYTSIVTGHSLGGALCSIAAVSLVHDFPGLKAYSLGQFRTGNPAYAAYVDRLLPYPAYSRITHTNDGVPQTIPASYGYAHHSTEFWELEPFGPDHTYRCGPGDDPECNNSTLGLGLAGAGTSQGINAAHLCYSGILMGNPVDAGASACNAVSLLPRECSTATLGGII